MIKFQFISANQCYGFCYQLRQCNIMARVLRLKEITSISNMVQSKKYGSSRVITRLNSETESSKLTYNVNKYKSNRNFSQSVSTAVISVRPVLSCVHHSSFLNDDNNGRCRTTSNSSAKFNLLKFPPSSISSTTRQYSTSQNETELCCFGLMKFHNNKPPMPPQLLPVNFFKHIFNMILAFQIRTEFDRNFSIKSLLQGSRMAIMTVSSTIAEGRFEQLKGLVEEQARKEIEFNCSRMPDRTRRLIEMHEEDCSSILSSSYLNGLRILRQDKDVILEASVVFKCFRNTEEILPNHTNLEPNIKAMYSKLNENLQLCNYIFHKKMSKDSENSWIVNRLEHFACLGPEDRMD